MARLSPPRQHNCQNYVQTLLALKMLPYQIWWWSLHSRQTGVNIMENAPFIILKEQAKGWAMKVASFCLQEASCWQPPGPAGHNQKKPLRMWWGGGGGGHYRDLRGLNSRWIKSTAGSSGNGWWWGYTSGGATPPFTVLHLIEKIL